MAFSHSLQKQIDYSNYKETTVTQVASFIAEHNLSVSLSSSLLDLIKARAPKDPKESSNLLGITDRVSPKGNDYQYPEVVRKRDGTALAAAEMTTTERFQYTFNRQPETESNNLRRQTNVVPGGLSYAEVVQQQRAPFRLQENTSKVRPQGYREFHREKPEIAIIGDSIVGGINRRDINTETKDYFVTVKTFKGATVDEMDSYIIPTIKKQTEGLIIHCGTNNLRKDDPDIIASKILSLAFEAKQRIKHVAVSSLIARGDPTSWRIGEIT
eukprot:gene4934-5581_t